MTARIRLPRILAETTKTGIDHQVQGATVGDALDDLFAQRPGLRHHILDESGTIRPHVSIFVDADQAGLDTSVGNGSDIRILHAVSGGESTSIKAELCW